MHYSFFGKNFTTVEAVDTSVPKQSSLSAQLEVKQLGLYQLSALVLAKKSFQIELVPLCSLIYFDPWHILPERQNLEESLFTRL